MYYHIIFNWPLDCACREVKSEGVKCIVQILKVNIKGNFLTKTNIKRLFSNVVTFIIVAKYFKALEH
jgi:hypothetical protein